MEQMLDGRHSLTLEKRNKMQLTGVTEVISFDELTIAADTDCGIIVIKGEGLHISSLDLDKGNMSLDGSIDSVVYEDSDGCGGKPSFFSKLFR